MKYLGGFLVFTIFSFGFYLLFSEYKKVISYKPTSWTEDQSADCGVVLTGGSYGSYRVVEGFNLLNQKQIKKLIISGVNPKAGLNDIFPRLVFYGNVNRKDIILEKRSLTTFGNAQQSFQLMEALYCRDIVLITSTIHMHRALKTFNAVVPENFPIYPRAIVPGRYKPKVFDVVFESIKSLFYSIWAY